MQVFLTEHELADLKERAGTMALSPYLRARALAQRTPSSRASDVARAVAAIASRLDALRGTGHDDLVRQLQAALFHEAQRL